MRMIAYVDAGVVAVIAAGAAGGLAGVKTLVSAKMPRRRKNGGDEQRVEVNEALIQQGK